jgi:chromosome segregation ATPase
VIEGIIVALISVLVTGMVTFFVAARRMSGKIATSDASDLWDESKSIREDYRDQLSAANKRLIDLEVRTAKLESRNNDLERENWELRKQIVTLESQVADLQKVIDSLQETIESQRSELAEKEGK